MKEKALSGLKSLLRSGGAVVTECNEAVSHIFVDEEAEFPKNLLEDLGPDTLILKQDYISAYLLSPKSPPDPQSWKYVAKVKEVAERARRKSPRRS